MPIQRSKAEMLLDEVYLSMSRQLRSNNPVLEPAVCCLTAEEIADLTETNLLFIIVAVQNRLKDDKHEVDVRYVMTPEEPHACMLVGAALESSS